MGVEPSTGAWAVCQKLYPQRRVTPFPLKVINFQYLLYQGWVSEVSVPTHAGIWTGLLLCCSCSGNHNCCELICAITTSWPGTRISQFTFSSQGFTFFPCIFQDALWVIVTTFKRRRKQFVLEFPIRATVMCENFIVTALTVQSNRQSTAVWAACGESCWDSGPTCMLRKEKRQWLGWKVSGL